MAEAEVSSMIGNILDAFRNGLNVFQGMGRKHRRSHSDPSRVDVDGLILDSLSQRPQEIRQTYDSMVKKHGQGFHVGDTTAQTSLAQILLVFNTGLIRLLNRSLSEDKKSRSSARSGILTLSETAAMDTLIALSELDLRLASAPKLGAKPTAPNKSRPRASSCGQLMAIRRPPPTPRLQNGGWVRSKSDPSAVSVVVACKAKKSEQRKGSGSQSRSNSPTSSTRSTSLLPAKEPKSPPPRYSQPAPRSPPRPRPKPLQLQTCPANILTTVPENAAEKRLIRHPSMYIVPSDFFDAFQSAETSRYNSHSVTKPLSSPPVPPKIPLHSYPVQNQSRDRQAKHSHQSKGRNSPAADQYPLHQAEVDARGENRVRPVSMMTFMTASTKIGEIPEHRLPDRELTQEEREQIPMPYVVPEMLDPPKRKTRGMRFWK